MMVDYSRITFVLRFRFNCANTLHWVVSELGVGLLFLCFIFLKGLSCPFSKCVLIFVLLTKRCVAGIFHLLS